MDIQNISTAVQAASAAVIVWLTWRLSRTAKNALKASNDQVEATEKTLAEMRKDRHLGAVPMLGIKPGAVEWPSEGDGNPSVVLLVKNDTAVPAINVRVRLGEARDLGAEPDSWAAVPAPIPWIGGAGEARLPVGLNLFTPVLPDRKLRTTWVCIRVTFEGPLRAKITQTLYWEPNDWAGLDEPLPGKGELLRLWSITGTSGAEPNDISWSWSPAD